MPGQVEGPSLPVCFQRVLPWLWGYCNTLSLAEADPHQLYPKAPIACLHLTDVSCVVSVPKSRQQARSHVPGLLGVRLRAIPSSIPSLVSPLRLPCPGCATSALPA